MTLRLAFALTLCLFVLVGHTTVARAGGCTVCTTSDECVDLFGEPAFCVLWTDPSGGCASARQICCPGQGCSTFDGRPSCEAEGRCTVVEEVDAGASATDAGTTGTDSGAAAVDSGVAVDAARADGGSTTVVAAGGCACRVGSRAPLAGTSMLALLLGALIAVRRRR